MPKIKVIPLLEVIFKNHGGTSDIWKTVSELLHNKEEEISVFCPYIKNKINSYDKETSILALTLLDFCVDDGTMLLWSALNTKSFLGSVINNLKTKEDTEIQNMILYLIQKWGKKFDGNEELSNFRSVYNLLKKNNISFPTETNHKYSKYVKINKNESYKQASSINNVNERNNRDNMNMSKRNNKDIIVETEPEDYLKDINVDLKTSSYDSIYKRLVNKLYDWTHAIHEVNILINDNRDGKNNEKIEGLCKDLTKGKRQLNETIQSGKLKDNTLMEISLNVNDDINMTLGRWNNNKNGRDPGPFVSSFFQNEEWRKKKLNKINNNNKTNNNNSNFNNINNFYNINNSTFNNNINNSNNFNNNTNNNNFNIYNSITNNNINKFNNTINQINNSNFLENPELKNYPKLYEKLKNNNNNNYQNNNFQNNNFFNFQNNNSNINNMNTNNQQPFNLLIDFDTTPVPTTNMKNDLNLNLNDKNNMDNFVDLIAMTEKQNEINNKKSDIFNNDKNKINNNDFNNKYENKNINNNNTYNYENKDSDNPYNDRKFSNDNINKSTINNTMIYPSFEELDEPNANNNNNLNSNKIIKDEPDILSKFDF